MGASQKPRAAMRLGVRPSGAVVRMVNSAWGPLRPQNFSRCGSSLCICQCLWHPHLAQTSFLCFSVVPAENLPPAPPAFTFPSRGRSQIFPEPFSPNCPGLSALLGQLPAPGAAICGQQWGQTGRDLWPQDRTMSRVQQHVLHVTGRLKSHG